MAQRLEDKIERVMDERVRPQLKSHHGDVVVASFEDGVLKVRMLGQCSGCPSASLTVENIVAEEVKAAVPEVKDVVLLNGVSDELIAQARALMRHRDV